MIDISLIYSIKVDNLICKILPTRAKKGEAQCWNFGDGCYGTHKSANQHR